MTEPVIHLHAVGKRYVRHEDTPTLLGHALRAGTRRRRSKALWAVRDLDLAVSPGETFGVIGRNGSGKTTMLRMMAGVTAPTEGTVAVRGRVAPLIAVGVGFHPELTGRENVYVNGTILGLTRREIDRRFDEIVAFSEIESFIDSPVKLYSSGMFVRLGFAVAVTVDPDVLIVDEVLAVGDLGFQMKCYRRIQELQERGTTVVVVSHNLDAVRSLCDRVLVLHDGRSVFLGGAVDAISAYHDRLDAASGGGDGTAAGVLGGVVEGAAPVDVTGFEIVGPSGEPTAHVRTGDEVRLRVRARFRSPVEHAAFTLAITAESGVVVYADSNYTDGGTRFTAGDEACCEIRVPMPLTTGSYSARAGVMWGHDRDSVRYSRPVMFYVSGRHLLGGVADLGATFEVGPASSRSLSR